MSDSLPHLDIEKIAEHNPNVDLDQFREAQAQLKEIGVNLPGYGIRPQHERRPLTREPGLRRKMPA
jgi:hypothetical protein